MDSTPRRAATAARARGRHEIQRRPHVLDEMMSTRHSPEMETKRPEAVLGYAAPDRPRASGTVGRPSPAGIFPSRDGMDAEAKPMTSGEKAQAEFLEWDLGAGSITRAGIYDEDE